MENMDKLLAIMSSLRNEHGGCPWDKEQTLESLVPHTLEEAYEVADAIDNGSHDELKCELGDLLFQIVFYARIAREQQWFDFSDVVNAISEKLVRRHPHVFADDNIESVEEQTAAWEEHKKKERSQQGLSKGALPGELDGVINALPALTRSQKLQRRAARAGFDWDNVDPVYAKLSEEIEEVREAVEAGQQNQIEEEIGDLLFACVNLARHLGVDSENALRKGNRKFERRFREMEKRLSASGQEMNTLSVKELDRLWGAVKVDE